VKRTARADKFIEADDTMMFGIAGGITGRVIWAEGTAGVFSLLAIVLVFFWAAIAQWGDGPGNGPYRGARRRTSGCRLTRGGWSRAEASRLARSS
jgi:hypothetical protein